MDLRFEIGSAEEPLGHALIYFTASGVEPVVLATYVFVPPIPFNVEKYIPPAFASFMPSTEVQVETAAPIPPVAEEVESVEWLRMQARARRDDLVYAGVLYSRDLPNVAAMTQEATAEYARLYRQRLESQQLLAPTFEVDYTSMSEEERLAEMTHLVGRLRDILGTPEADAVRSELERLASALPPKYRAWEVVEAATVPGEIGQQLASLHLARCYKLLNEQYLEVADIERQIEELKGRKAGQ
jgi:hypothetical protein